MYKIKPFAEDDDIIVVEKSKPRNKAVNDILLSKRGGRMKSDKDTNRQKDKQKLRKQLKDFDVY
jgi:hypothetical protein